MESEVFEIPLSALVFFYCIVTKLVLAAIYNLFFLLFVTLSLFFSKFTPSHTAEFYIGKGML